MSESKPKVLLFDIGGVCVVSPFQAILDYELSLGIPPGWVNYSISRTAPNGFWHRLEKGEIPMDESFFKGFSQDLHDPTRWDAFYKREQSKDPNLSQEAPPVPAIDAEWLFNEMMTVSNSPDPWMYPALKKLKENGQFILAALSNTVIFHLVTSFTSIISSTNLYDKYSMSLFHPLMLESANPIRLCISLHLPE
ncbi:hypothetical protein NXS19_003676 [Fusarium pseudograminearum]|nr:hypothetical protein NXS19_003676 [Fusarium pseudograminearum]